MIHVGVSLLTYLYTVIYLSVHNNYAYIINNAQVSTVYMILNYWKFTGVGGSTDYFWKCHWFLMIFWLTQYIFLGKDKAFTLKVTIFFLVFEIRYNFRNILRHKVPISFSIT